MTYRDKLAIVLYIIFTVFCWITEGELMKLYKRIDLMEKQLLIIKAELKEELKGERQLWQNRTPLL